MKLLYNINKVVIIMNLILIVIPFFGLIFMFITGCIQVISFIVFLFLWKKIAYSLRRYFLIYPILVGIALAILSLEKDVSFVISLSLSASMAIGFVFLLKKQRDITAISIQES